MAYFTGCAINYIYPRVGFDVIGVLAANGVEVVIPAEQQCCGIAVFAHGDVEAARYLARRNLDVFEKSGADYIITSCGSCGGAWQHDYPEDLLPEDPEYSEQASQWSRKTHDISTFLVNILGDFKKPAGIIKSAVTYHDSCHLKKVMKVTMEPRKILQSIPGVDFREMAKSDACCGGGGSYTITHEETSRGIMERKMLDVNKSNADILATGCPGCMMQLMEGCTRFGKGQEVTHFVSLLAESYRLAD